MLNRNIDQSAPEAMSKAAFELVCNDFNCVDS